jgi:hypothetical protein
VLSALLQQLPVLHALRLSNFKEAGGTDESAWQLPPSLLAMTGLRELHLNRMQLESLLSEPYLEGEDWFAAASVFARQKRELAVAGCRPPSLPVIC